MTNGAPDRQAMVFNEHAADYERNRPAYPAAAFDHLLDEIIGNSGERLRVLEIGAGSGKATVPLAERGCQVVALEPGEHLAAIARERVAGHSDVEIMASTFEEAEIAPEHFDVVFAAQSFHWTDPATRYQRVRRALVDGGRLVVLANGPIWPDTDPVKAAIARIYDELAPELTTCWPAGRKQGADGRSWTEDIDHSGLFGAVESVGWPWQLDQDGAAYTKHLGTQSDHRLFDADRRAELFDALETLIADQANDDRHRGTITVPHETRLWTAVRR